MSTNYYLQREANKCEHCGRYEVEERLHIGKSAGSWAFAIQLYPDRGIRNLVDWQRQWLRRDWIIVDEYGEYLTPQEMLAVIENRDGRPEEGRRPPNCASWAEFHQLNHSRRGNRNLLFSVNEAVEDGPTWQTFSYEFS